MPSLLSKLFFFSPPWRHVAPSLIAAGKWQRLIPHGQCTPHQLLYTYTHWTSFIQLTRREAKRSLGPLDSTFLSHLQEDPCRTLTSSGQREWCYIPSVRISAKGSFQATPVRLFRQWRHVCEICVYKEDFLAVPDYSRCFVFHRRMKYIFINI